MTQSMHTGYNANDPVLGRIPGAPDDNSPDLPPPQPVNQNVFMGQDPHEVKRPKSTYTSVDDLVNRLTPPTDPRDDDLTYHRLLDDLLHEFNSSSPTVQYQIAWLASDILRAARFREAIDRLQNFESFQTAWLRQYEQKRQISADEMAIYRTDHYDTTRVLSVFACLGCRNRDSCAIVLWWKHCRHRLLALVPAVPGGQGEDIYPG